MSRNARSRRFKARRLPGLFFDIAGKAWRQRLAEALAARLPVADAPPPGDAHSDGQQEPRR